MKNTRQRNAILNIVNTSNNHDTAYMIFKKAQIVLPNISLGTVYRNLKSLEEEHMIQSIECLKEKHYDKIKPHDHFICQYCHEIIDIFDLNFVVPEKYQNNIINDHKIVLMGICEKCQKEENNGIKRK